MGHQDKMSEEGIKEGDVEAWSKRVFEYGDVNKDGFFNRDEVVSMMLHHEFSFRDIDKALKKMKEYQPQGDMLRIGLTLEEYTQMNQDGYDEEQRNKGGMPRMEIHMEEHT